MHGDLQDKYDNEVQHAPLETDASHMMVIKNLMCGTISLDCAASLYGTWYKEKDWNPNDWKLNEWKCNYECWGQWSNSGAIPINPCNSPKDPCDPSQG